MAEDKIDGTTWQRLLPWTLLFRAFQVTLDMNKLLLAVGGIVVTWLIWALLTLIFTANESKTPPDWSDGTHLSKNNDNVQKAWKEFREELNHWNLMHEATDLYKGSDPQRYRLVDLVESPQEYNDFKDLENAPPGPETLDKFRAKIQAFEEEDPAKARRYRARLSRYALLGQPKPSGRLNVSPWSEDRGPNPFLLVTGQAGTPWETGGFFDWFSRDQLPVMLEPLFKMIRPIVYFLSPGNTFVSRLYFLTIILSTVLIWSFFGGAITRIAAVQLTRGERIGLVEAVRFSLKRVVHYFLAPIFPLVVVLILTIILAIVGLLGPLVGLFYFLALLFGLIMAMALVGLIGWPLMVATISTEGTDSWEAVTRSYGYVYQRPWHYAWYALVSVFYGGLVIFFVGFMGSLTVYLSKWSVTQISARIYDSNSLFAYAPTSFGWRELLLEGAVVEIPQEEKDPKLQRLDGVEVVAGRTVTSGTYGTVGGINRWSRINDDAYKQYVKSLGFLSWLGALLVAFWLGLAFLLVLSFGYVFFWTAGTISYLLLRKSLESAELDEVYVEEEDFEATFRAPVSAEPAPAAASRASSLPVVEAPAAVPISAPTPAPAPAPTPEPVKPTIPEPPPPEPKAEHPVEPMAEEPAEPKTEAPSQPSADEPAPQKKEDDDTPPGLI